MTNKEKKLLIFAIGLVLLAIIVVPTTINYYSTKKLVYIQEKQIAEFRDELRRQGLRKMSLQIQELKHELFRLKSDLRSQSIILTDTVVNTSQENSSKSNRRSSFRGSVSTYDYNLDEFNVYDHLLEDKEPSNGVKGMKKVE